jgi:glutathione S-transferase
MPARPFRSVFPEIRMPLKLFHFEACPYCEKIRYAMRRLDLRYESVEIDPADRSAVKAVSGQEKVPVLVDGEVVVHDSSRILRYLVRTYGGGRLLPDEPRSRALAWILEEYADEVLGPLLHRSARGTDGEGQPLNEAGKAALKTDLSHHFEALEQLFLGDEHALGSRVTLGDIALYAFLSRLELYSPRGIPADYPRIKAWYARMKV